MNEFDAMRVSTLVRMRHKTLLFLLEHDVFIPTMSLIPSSLIVKLVIASYYITILSDEMEANKFDLNALPDEIQSDQISESPVTVKIVGISSDKGTKDESTVDPKQKKKGQTISSTFYDKVLRLLDVLKVCDDKNFDIENIEIPNDFSAENKAIMALTHVAKKNLIKKRDMRRFRLIMKNCAQLSQAVQKKIEDSMSIDSQTSGGTYEDRLKRLSESPMEDFKSRFDSRGSGIKWEPKDSEIVKPGTGNNFEKWDQIDHQSYSNDFDANDQAQIDLDPPGFIKFL